MVMINFIPIERRAGILATVVVALLAASPAFAQLEEPAKDADHAKQIMEIMKGREFKLWGPAPYEKELISLCRRLGEGLRTQTGITHIEPVARSKYYHDPVFRPFRDRCPGLELNGLLWPAGRMDPVEGPEATKITEEELEEFLRDWGLKLFGTRNFKMYRLDLDGDASNGEEHVFYAERFYTLRKVVGLNFRYHLLPRSIDWNDLMRPEFVEGLEYYSDGSFLPLDLDHCKRLRSFGVNDRYNLREHPSVDAFSGIFRYRGRPYFYNVYPLDTAPGTRQDDYQIRTMAFDGKGFEHQCQFEQEGPKDGPQDRSQ